MTPYDKLEILERAAVNIRRLRVCTEAEQDRDDRSLAGFLNHMAARWGCHYTVTVAHLRARHGNDPFGFGTRMVSRTRR